MPIQIEVSEQDLPVLSVVASKALELLQDPNITHNKLEELIRRDPSMTSRLLHIANSPFYSTKMEAKSISDAARVLGMQQLNNIIIAAATGELFDANDSVAQTLWDHAQTGKAAARHREDHHLQATPGAVCRDAGAIAGDGKDDAGVGDRGV